MDGNGGKDRQVLQRIAALLVAFAALAGSAGRKPRPVRVVVLWLLRMAEAVALDFVVELAEESGGEPGLADLLRDRDIADEATRLARSFTALAALLAAIARRNPSPLASGRAKRAIARLAARMTRTLQALALALPEPAPPDTS